MKAKNIGSAKY